MTSSASFSRHDIIHLVFHLQHRRGFLPTPLPLPAQNQVNYSWAAFLLWGAGSRKHTAHPPQWSVIHRHLLCNYTLPTPTPAPREGWWHESNKLLINKEMWLHPVTALMNTEGKICYLKIQLLWLKVDLKKKRYSSITFHLVWLCAIACMHNENRTTRIKDTFQSNNMKGDTLHYYIWPVFTLFCTEDHKATGWPHCCTQVGMMSLDGNDVTISHALHTVGGAAASVWSSVGHVWSVGRIF